MKKTKIIYMFSLIISGIFVYIYPNKYFATLFYLMLFLPIFSLLSLFYVYLRFKLSHKLDSNKVLKGDNVVYTCSIHNKDIFPFPEIKVVFEGEHLIFQDQVVSSSVVLMPKSSFDIDINLSCKYWGRYKVGVKYIEIVDFFNLFKFRFKNFPHKKILVYPRINYFKNLSVSRIGNLENGIKDKRRILTNQSLVEIKDFEYGEKLSLIHWKLSTRLGKLMSKKMESITDEKYIVLMDLYRSELDYEENIVLEDSLIELFVAFGNFVLSNNIAFDLKYMLPEGYIEDSYSFNTQFDFFYEKAASMQFSKTKTICDLITDLHLKLSTTSIDQGKIFIFTSNLSNELLELLEIKVFRGYDVSIFYVSSRELDHNNTFSVESENELLNKAFHLGIKIHKLDISDKIQNLMDGEIIWNTCFDRYSHL